ncbi:MAG TPA: DUF1634 domain-containing protein [Nitrososphaerales archaeon]|nr:DUF1634 domain-containing protein [Nitrososphaerales archaeon]
MSLQRPRADINDTIGKILRYGVAMSSAVVAAGLVLMLLVPSPGTPGTLQGTIAANFGGPTLSLSALMAGVARGNAVSVLQAGILLLIATPITRVAASVLLFLRERDMLYVGVTLLVLGMLLFALFVVGPLEA